MRRARRNVATDPAARIQQRLSKAEGKPEPWRSMRSDDNGPLRVVRGTVDTNIPSIVAGAGFTISKSSTGTVVVTFNTAFPTGSPPTVTLGSSLVPGVNWQTVQLTSDPVVGNFGVTVHDQAFNAQNGKFWFIAIGPA